jgi:hypothetical protein
MPLLSIHGIVPQFLTIDGVVIAPIPRDPSILYAFAPPEQFVVTEGQHALRYDLDGARAAFPETPQPASEPPIEVRVNVPAEGLELRRIDRFLIDPRGIQTPTGNTGLAPMEHGMGLDHKLFMAAGTVAIAAWVWHFLAGDD